MRDLFEKLPWPVEFAVVVAGAFGLAVLGSLIAAVQPPATGSIHSEASLWQMVGNEVFITALLGGFLFLRGWTVERLGLKSHWMDGVYGLALTAAVYAVYVIAQYALTSLAPGLAAEAAKLQVVPHAMSPWLIGAVTIVNSFYEELFVSGYVITALKERTSETIAINVSVAIRLSYHLYQGVLGVISIIPIGLIFAYWFARKGSLWPLILAHAVIDLIAFLSV
jgi:membrane protease YdiL (CAAX protease family)